MQPTFHKLNYYALMACILSKVEITSDHALKEMGLAKKMNCDHKYCGKIQKIFDKDLEKVKKLYFEDHMTLDQIANIYGCSAMTIGNLFRKFGVQTKRKGGNKNV